MIETQVEQQVCCPRFDPTPWDNKMIMWKNKHFIHDHVRTFMYMPVGFGKAMRHLDIIAGDHAQPDGLCLSDHKSPWSMDLFLAVDGPIPGADNVDISGNFFCKVYEGKFKETGEWMEDFEQAVKDRDLQTSKVYMWYTTCPDCAKKYGKNYVVILGKTD